VSGPRRDPGQVRPYAITGGRTRPVSLLELPMETLVTVTQRGLAALPLLALEWREIAMLCERPAAVAEIAARLRVPLGVGRVLVADMVAEGLLSVTERGGGRPATDPAVLGRVIDGLRSM
jgi:hypothetical protein